MSGKQLTESIRDVAETLGVGLAQDLVDNFGGLHLYVPMDIRPHHELSKRLGLRKARELASCFGGTHFDVPMHLFNEEKARRTLVVTLRGKRVSISRIAREAKCTERRVRQILADAEKKSRPTLF